MMFSNLNSLIPLLIIEVNGHYCIHNIFLILHTASIYALGSLNLIKLEDKVDLLRSMFYHYTLYLKLVQMC